MSGLSSKVLHLRDCSACTPEHSAESAPPAGEAIHRRVEPHPAQHPPLGSACAPYSGAISSPHTGHAATLAAVRPSHTPAIMSSSAGPPPTGSASEGATLRMLTTIGSASGRHP